MPPFRFLQQIAGYKPANVGTEVARAEIVDLRLRIVLSSREDRRIDWIICPHVIIGKPLLIGSGSAVTDRVAVGIAIVGFCDNIIGGYNGHGPVEQIGQDPIDRRRRLGRYREEHQLVDVLPPEINFGPGGGCGVIAFLDDLLAVVEIISRSIRYVPGQSTIGDGLLNPPVQGVIDVGGQDRTCGGVADLDQPVERIILVKADAIVEQIAVFIVDKRRGGRRAPGSVGDAGDLIDVVVRPHLGGAGGAAPGTDLGEIACLPVAQAIEAVSPHLIRAGQRGRGRDGGSRINKIGNGDAGKDAALVLPQPIGRIIPHRKAPVRIERLVEVTTALGFKMTLVELVARPVKRGGVTDQSGRVTVAMGGTVDAACQIALGDHLPAPS